MGGWICNPHFIWRKSPPFRFTVHPKHITLWASTKSNENILQHSNKIKVLRYWPHLQVTKLNKAIRSHILLTFPIPLDGRRGVSVDLAFELRGLAFDHLHVADRYFEERRENGGFLKKTGKSNPDLYRRRRGCERSHESTCNGANQISVCRISLAWQP